jgi:hypothetical protein
LWAKWTFFLYKALTLRYLLWQQITD